MAERLAPADAAKLLTTGAIGGSGTPADPTLRPTARVILLDPSSRLLLFNALEPDQETGRPFWFPPGGGVEPNETHEEAALREVLEETGIELPDLGPCVWHRVHDWQVGTHWFRSDERYFVGNCAGSAVSRDGWTELELQAIGDSRWWSLQEIRSSTDIFVPRVLADILPPILRGEYPAPPIHVL